MSSKTPYQCILLTTKEYNLTLNRVLAHPVKSKKYTQFSEKYKSVAKAIKTLETSDPDKHLLQIIKNLKDEMKVSQESMAKIIDSEFRVMQRENKSSKMKSL